jgi:hypothetical protein
MIGQTAEQIAEQKSKNGPSYYIHHKIGISWRYDKENIYGQVLPHVRDMYNDLCRQSSFELFCHDTDFVLRKTDKTVPDFILARFSRYKDAQSLTIMCVRDGMSLGMMSCGVVPDETLKTDPNMRYPFVVCLDDNLDAVAFPSLKAPASE